MFAFVGSLIHTSIFNTSRQKVMLRRRKRQSKRQKAAKKQLKQHDPKLSLAHQLKILQIQKQLDRKIDVNYHLNEIMEDLFYPDVRYANEQQLQNNVLKITAIIPKKQQLLSAHQSNFIKQNQNVESGQRQQIQQVDQIIQQIYLCQLPSEMFQLFNNNFEYFGLNHTITLLNRLRSYFKNRQKIKEKLTKKWAQSVQKMKQMSQEKLKIKKRCPYIFLDMDDLIRDEGWVLMIKKLSQILIEAQTKKIQLKQQKKQNEQQNQQSQQKSQKIFQKQQIQYLNQVKQTYNQVHGICELILTLQKSAGYIPSNIYQIFTNRIVRLSQKKAHQRSRRQAIVFQHNQMVKILLVLTNKNNVKSHYTSYVNIQSPDSSKQIQQKVLSLGKQLIKHILVNQKCTAQDLGAVIRTSKGVYKFIDNESLELAKSKIIKFLPVTNLQRSIDYLHCYWRNGTQKDMEFITILKYDIYRKLSSSFSKIHLFNLLKMIKYGQIHFKQSKTTLQITQIYEKIIETIVSYMQKYSLKHQEIQQLLKSIYESYPVCEKSQVILSNKMSVLEIICGQIIKMGDGYTLEDLSDLLFRANVLGYKSKVFAKYVFDRYKNQYRKQVKKYRQQKIQLLPTQSTNKEIYNELPLLKEIQLNQHLIMMLWCVITTIKSKQLQVNSVGSIINFNQILQMWILKVRTDDSLIWQLISNLNRVVKQEKLFPQIKIISDIFHMSLKQPQTNFQLLSSLPSLPTLKTRQYHLENKIFNIIQNISNNQIKSQQVLMLTSIFMRIQAQLSQCFFGNFSLKHRKFLQNYSTAYLTNHKNLLEVVQKDYFLEAQYLDWVVLIQETSLRKNYFNNNILIQDKQYLQKSKIFLQKIKVYKNNILKDKEKNEMWKRQFSDKTKKYQFIS